jgi:hypothetical protein
MQSNYTSNLSSDEPPSPSLHAQSEPNAKRQNEKQLFFLAMKVLGLDDEEAAEQVKERANLGVMTSEDVAQIKADCNQKLAKRYC